jgi:hypothetical protein
MAEWTGVEGTELIQTRDVAEVVRLCLRLSPHARISQIVVENIGESGDILTRGDVLSR